MDAFTRLIYTAMSMRIKSIEQYNHQSLQLQERQLKRVLRCLQATEYGRRYNAHTVKNAEDYAKALPIVSYDNIASYTERMLTGERNLLVKGGCDRFAVSSGTSAGRSKRLPVNALHLQACHFKGASDTLWLYLSTRPDSRFFATKGLTLGGSQKPVSLMENISQGDLSSILIEKMPSLGNMIRVPSKQTLLMEEWDAKMEQIIREVAYARVGSISGVPSWMLHLIKGVLEYTGKESLSDVWPDLEVFFHGGISFLPYQEEYRRLIPSPKMQYRETYNASEGFFGIQNDPSDTSLLLMFDYGIYYEFVPLSELDKEHPSAVPLEGVKVGTTYALVISTLGGLYRYMLGDTISFTSTHPYKIKIVGRTASYINAFGEELMVFNADAALSKVAQEFGVTVRDYTAAPLFLNEEGKGRHDWVIEFEEAPQDVEAFALRLHELLRLENSDYDAKSYNNMTLLPLKIYIAPSGTFNAYLASEGKLGGQHKVPRLKNDRTLIDRLLDIIKP